MYDDTIADPAFNQSWGGFDQSRAMFDVRVHGNPFLDCGSVAWEDSTEVKRNENQAYVDATDDAESADYVMEIFDNAPAISEYTLGSFMILDHDDPELLEYSPTELHERLTSHLADLYADTETWQALDWAVPTMRYLEKTFLTTIESGHVPGAILLEPIRQRMGFPYEWLGAPAE